MAEAFARRRMWTRARGVIDALPGLADSEDGRAALGRIEEARRVDSNRRRG
jgi:hypothetical protein